MILLTSLTNAAEITCQWNVEICTISSMTPVNQPNETITIAGKPANYINTATKYPSLFMMRQVYLSYVPTRMFYIFPNIIDFVMVSSSPTTTLVTDAFVSCTSLVKLYIQHANVSNIPAGFAQSCINMKKLMLYSNEIQTIDKNAFKGLMNLMELYLNDNKISCLPPAVFQTIPNIQFIILMNNRISAIDSTLFRNLPKLHTIKIENNLISYLPTLDLTGSATQSENFQITLHANPIYAIKPDFCNVFNSLPASLSASIGVSVIKCLPSTHTTIIDKFNCQSAMASYLQKCYSNWTLSMSVSVVCVSPRPRSSIWQQLLDYLNIKI